MITDWEKWHCVAVKNLPALLKERTSNLDGDYYCIVSTHLEEKINLNHIKMYPKSYGYCPAKMPKKYANILKYSQWQRSVKVSFVIYLDTEPLLEKIRTSDSNPEKWFT